MYGKKEAPAIRILQEAGEDVGRFEYAFTERGGTKDAARQLGLCEHDIVKSLVFDDGQGGHAVMALMHGDTRVSLRKLERLSGIRRLYPSSPAAARELTGYLPGGICPFGLISPIPVFLQETLLQMPQLFVNAGRRGVIAVVSPRVFDLVSPIVGNFASTGTHRV